MDRLSQFEQWVKEGNRSVTIEIEKLDDKTKTKIWVFDYDLSEGQFVNSIDEINLEEEKISREKELYEQLKAKFEPLMVS